MLDRVKRKYGPTLEKCLVRREALRAELSDLDRGDERLAELDRECAASKAAFVESARRLSAERRRVAVAFSRLLESVAGELAMENARVELRFADELPESDWSARGLDRAEFFVSTNPGEDLRPLTRVVSGGELSRLMLAIKTLTATSRLGSTDADERPGSAAAPGLIFDEVDAGIGGRVAEVVGRKLHALGSAFQVLCITHQPQSRLSPTRTSRSRSASSTAARIPASRGSIGRRASRKSAMLGGSVTQGLKASARSCFRAESAGRPARRQAKGESKSKGESERAKAKGRRGA